MGGASVRLAVGPTVGAQECTNGTIGLAIELSAGSHSGEANQSACERFLVRGRGRITTELAVRTCEVAK